MQRRWDTMQVHAPNFGIEECRNEREKEFILALHARAESWNWSPDCFPSCDGRFIISISIGPGNRVSRSPRIDFDGDTLLLGDDETLQFVTDLDPSRPGVIRESGKPPTELARIAADWFEQQMSEPMESEPAAIAHNPKRSLVRRIGEFLGF